MILNMESFKQTKHLFILIYVCTSELRVRLALLMCFMPPALALLYKMFCVLTLFPYGVLSQVWYLIVSIPDLCIFLTLREFSTTLITIESE